ncbi:MAG: hypothetical protein NTV97_26875 [Alphaproteobacteria bacterium]|nr:hypothetical protein [Alphaproteobacteria bacterium]
MSLYEALVLLALAAAGGYAYYLYRLDTRPKPPGTPEAEPPKSGLMFGRTPQDRTASGPADKSKS